MGFPKVFGLEVIPYSVSIGGSLNSWQINFYPWSYEISLYLDYLDSHVFSTNFAIDIAILWLYCAISNHPVTGLIMVTAFRCKFYFCPFLLMTQGLIIFTHSLFHGIFSDNLADNLPYFLFDCFVHLQVLRLVTSLRTEFIMPVQ